MYSRKKFQVKPTTLNTYFMFADLGCLFLSCYFSSNCNSNHNNMASQGTLLGNWATQLCKGGLSEFRLVVPPVRRLELAAGELAWVWNMHGCVCLRSCIGPLRMSCISSWAFSTGCLFSVTSILHLPFQLRSGVIYTNIWYDLESFFSLSYLITTLSHR